MIRLIATKNHCHKRAQFIVLDGNSINMFMYTEYDVKTCTVRPENWKEK